MTKDTTQKSRDVLNKGYETAENFRIQHHRRFEVLKHLWKIDDDAWMCQRKEEWRQLIKTICEGCGSKSLKAYGRFFLIGEEIPIDVHDIQMNFVTRFIMTPFTSPEHIGELYELVLHPHDKSRILGGFMGGACLRAPGMPWIRNHILNFREGVLGNEYKMIKASNGRREQVISPDPTAFCSDYVDNALKLIRREHRYNYSVDSLPYFISALSHVDRPKFRKFIKLQEMMDEVDKIIQQPDEHPELVQDLARQLKEREEEIWTNWKVFEHLDQPQ